jgi:aldehyde dehydrogenase (NAD+)
VGNGLDEKVEMGPSVSQGQLDTVMHYVEIGKKEAKLLAGGNRLTKGAFEHGFFHEPTVFGDVDRNAVIAQEEIFGPVVSIIAHNGLDEAIDICNDIKYGLSASIYTQDINKAYAAMRDVYTGIFYVNASTIGAEVHLPFGGTNETGNGHREAGNAALDVFSEWKSIYVDFSGKLQKAQIED